MRAFPFPVAILKPLVGWTAMWNPCLLRSLDVGFPVLYFWQFGPVFFLLRSGPDPDVVSPRCSGYGTLYREVIRLRNMVLSKLIFSFTGLFFLSSSLFHDFVCCWYRIWRETRETDWNETHHFSRMDWMSFLVVPSYLMSLGVKPDHFFHVGTNVWSPWTCEFPIIWVIFCGTQAKFQLLIGDSEFTMWHNGASLVCFFIFLVSPVHLPGCAFWGMMFMSKILEITPCLTLSILSALLCFPDVVATCMKRG